MATSVEMVKFAREDGTEVPAYSSAKGPKNGLVVVQVTMTAANGFLALLASPGASPLPS